MTGILTTIFDPSSSSDSVSIAGNVASGETEHRFEDGLQPFQVHAKAW